MKVQNPTSLTYPFDTPPEFGTLKEVAAGVYWLRMPLPMALNHINLYMLEDDDGWYIIDTGMRGNNKQKFWQQIFDNELKGKPVKGVYVTHFHPDHIGQAGWLCEKWRVPLYMTKEEYWFARVATSMPPGLSWTAEETMRRNGATEDRIERSRQGTSTMAKMVEPIPMAFHRLEEGDEFTVAGRQWRVVTGSGHCPEHACFYCAEIGVLLSGDQVIAGITSNISVLPMEPEANPLADWLRTLPKFYDLPDSTLVLPAHKLPFYGLHQRITELIQHHEDHMLALQQACKTPQTSIDLLPILFKRELNVSLFAMAQGECIAHLHLLMQRGLIKRSLSEQGVFVYASIATDTA